MCKYVCVCVYVCIHVCMCVYIYIHTCVHIHIQMLCSYFIVCLSAEKEGAALL